MLTAGIHTPLVDAGIVKTPFMVSIFFSAITVALALLIVDDVARSASAAARISAQNRRWQAMLDGIQLAVIRIDGSGAIAFLNPFAKRLLGPQSEHLLGQPLSRIAPQDEASDPMAFEARIASGGLVNVATPSGSNREILWFAVRIDDALGADSGLVVFGQDVTDVKRTEREVSRLRREIETLTRATMLGELASSITHELGQPIGALLSNVQSAQLLRQRAGGPVDEIDEILEDLLHDVRRSADIINRVRQFMRNHEPMTERFDLVTAIREVLELIDHEAKTKRVQITVVGEDACLVDAGRLDMQQICMNLVLNAIQALEGAACEIRRIEISVEKVDANVTLIFDDSGPGLPDRTDRHVFDAFVSGRKGGMGIGLSVCRRITEAHRGSVATDTSPLGGARFVIRLPIGVVEQMIANA